MGTVKAVIESAKSFSKSKISTSSRVTPIDTYKNSNIIFSKGWFLKLLFPLVNWKVDVMTCVSRDMIGQYRKIFGTTKQSYVYNIVKTFDVNEKMRVKNNHKWFKNQKSELIVAAGSLEKWKGFDDLIEAIDILIKKNIDLKLVIFGSGKEKYNLKKLIVSKKLTKKILILNPVLNILKFFYNSDIFVLSSKVEGMPNVMIEAMMCGCTVVANNCPTGPREILNKNKYGYLSKVNNPKNLSENILKAIKKKIKIKSTSKVLKKFTAEEVVKKHFLLLSTEQNLRVLRVQRLLHE